VFRASSSIFFCRWTLWALSSYIIPIDNFTHFLCFSLPSAGLSLANCVFLFLTYPLHSMKNNLYTSHVFFSKHANRAMNRLRTFAESMTYYRVCFSLDTRFPVVNFRKALKWRLFRRYLYYTERIQYIQTKLYRIV